VSVLVVAQSSSEIPEGLMNNPVYTKFKGVKASVDFFNLNELRQICAPWI